MKKIAVLLIVIVLALSLIPESVKAAEPTSIAPPCILIPTFTSATRVVRIGNTYVTVSYSYVKSFACYSTGDSYVPPIETEDPGKHNKNKPKNSRRW